MLQTPTSSLLHCVSRVESREARRETSFSEPEIKSSPEASGSCCISNSICVGCSSWLSSAARALACTRLPQRRKAGDVCLAHVSDMSGKGREGKGGGGCQAKQAWSYGHAMGCVNATQHFITSTAECKQARHAMLRSHSLAHSLAHQRELSRW